MTTAQILAQLPVLAIGTQMLNHAQSGIYQKIAANTWQPCASLTDLGFPVIVSSDMDMIKQDLTAQEVVGTGRHDLKVGQAKYSIWGLGPEAAKARREYDSIRAYRQFVK